MIEGILLVVKKLMGIGVVVVGGQALLDSSGDILGAGQDAICAAATEIEMGGAHKVITSYYIMANRYPDPNTEMWNFFSENYDEKNLAKLKADGWNRPFAWITPTYEIISAGPDGQYNGDDLTQPYAKNTKR